MTRNPNYYAVGLDVGPNQLDAMILGQLVSKSAGLKHAARNIFARSEITQPISSTTYPGRNTTMTTKLRIPSETVERRDISVALEVLGENVDYILNMISIVQDLELGDVVKRADRLKPSDLGRHVTIATGDNIESDGWMTDLIVADRITNYETQLVLDGSIVKVRNDDFVIVAAENASEGYIKGNFSTGITSSGDAQS